MRRWLGPADAILQQAAWWSAVVLAARGRPLLAAAGGALVVVAHLSLRPGERWTIARAAGVAALHGLATDTLLSAAGLVTFAGPGIAAPPWMIALWGAFGAALTASLARVAAARPALLALAGAVAGPLAYRAGAALGALDLPGGTAALAVVAAQWAIGVPLAAAFARGGRRAAAGRPPAAGSPRWAR